MKRIGIVLVIVLLLFLALMWFLGRSGLDKNAPRYVMLTAQPTGPFGREFHDSGGAVPFAGGKLWITSVPSGTNYHAYRYDLDQRRVVGEILDGWPVFASADGSKILCGGYDSPATSLKQRIGTGLNKLWPGKSPLIKMTLVETYWLLDTRDNSAKRLGELHHRPVSTTRWHPAPGSWRGYNVPNNQYEKHSFFLCDLEKGEFEKIELEGELIGWWDDHQIVFKDSTGDFRLFDLVTRKSSTLFSRHDLDSVLETTRIFLFPTTEINARALWNGSGFDLYFAQEGRNWHSGHGFLLKASKAHPQLELFSRDFKFGYLGWLDSSGRHYVYNGESGPSGQGGNGAVILRDLADGTEREIVPTNTVPVYAFPRFYSNSVIYSQNRTLWRVDLDNTNATRLLPPGSNP